MKNIERKIMKHPENVLDTFSGIGGFSLGLEQAGVQPKWIGYSDIDVYANSVFKRRFKNGHRLGSITDVSYDSLKGKRIDLFTGGFPCQAFSISGSRRGFKDSRGTLFFEIARVLEDYIKNGKPIPCILLENVKGLLNHDSGRTFAVVYRILSDLNYTIECQLVNTKWWLPQNRERIYILGRYNGNPSGRKVFPIYPSGKKNPKKSKGITIADWRSDEGLRIRKNGMSPTLTRATPPYIIKAHSLHTRGGHDEKAGGTGHLSKEDGTTYCIDAQNKQAVEINTRIRKLTPIECARLQGFPDNWNDNCSDSQRYKQYGNAITVNVAQAIFEKLYKEK
jgi:DNA (cytosine-5)-methyltransferase 1